jgi:putative MATE family efflux protein
MLIGNVFNGIIMGEGRMKHIMIAVIIATLSNCALDPLFIFTLGLGVRGAGLATVTAQLLAAVYILRLFIGGKTTVPLALKRGKRRFPVVMRIGATGFPHAVGQLSMSLSFLIFNRILLGIDPLAVTAFTLYARFDQVLLMPILSIGTAMITMVGQNYGALNHERIMVIWRTGLATATGVAGLLAVLIMVAAPVVYPLFSDIEEVVSYAVRQTRIVMPSAVLVSIVVLARSTFLALGRPVPALTINALRSIGIAAPAALLLSLVLKMGVVGVWVGMVAGNLITGGAALVWTGTVLRAQRARH